MNKKTFKLAAFGFSKPTSKVFAVVHFLSRDKVDIILKKWIFEENQVTQCYWPNVSSHEVRKMCICNIDASSEWDIYQVQIKYETRERINIYYCNSDYCAL